jgi:hypothetical protein
MYQPIDSILKLIKPEDNVLDVGGWESVFPRANVVIDINPYQTRKIVHPNLPEHFNQSSWLTGDLCSPVVWEKFQDKEFDFSVCSHTLEDVRDPLFLCRQLIRVSKAGYLEVPSPFRETCRANANDRFSGYDHHRWIVSVDDMGKLVFTPKLSWAHDFDYALERGRRCLNDYRFHFLSIYWTNSFSFYERMPKGCCIETENLFDFYESFNYESPEFVFELPEGDNSETTFVWVDKYTLPVEDKHKPEEILKRYQDRLSKC